MSIFLISPVRKITKKERKAIKEYVGVLENKGYTVYWPLRDTPQEDPYGGYRVCLTNFFKMREATEIHVWFSPKSEGSIFDLGMLFALIQYAEAYRGMRKRVLVANQDVLDTYVLVLIRKEVTEEKGIQNDFCRVLNELATRFS
jgi:hypothetical protein